jgi:hypothetical protein
MRLAADARLTPRPIGFNVSQQSGKALRDAVSSNN